MTLHVGSLFSGIGGFDLGLERAGMRVLWQCESDDFCRRVLARHWPGVPCHHDVSELRGADVEPVDVLAAGWPCPGFSVAGRGEGFDHEGSGLWTEVIRLVRELRPRYVVLENVAALLARGLWRVLGDLAESGYDAEWDCIPAAAVGAPHRRDRVWIVAYPNSESEHGGSVDAEVGWAPEYLGHAEGGWRDPASHQRPKACAGRERPRPARGSSVALGRSEWWKVEPDVGRVAHGVPARVDRLRSLGNALVPQIAEWIGRGIMNYEATDPSPSMAAVQTQEPAQAGSPNPNPDA